MMVAELTPNNLLATHHRRRGAMGYMLIAVLGYSLTPLVVAFGGDDSPFWFNMSNNGYKANLGWLLASVIGLVLPSAGAVSPATV